MKFPSFFKLPGHQRFEFRPRYYDPLKEELETRQRQIEAEIGKSRERRESHDALTPQTSISEAFARRRREQGKSNMMTSILALVFIIVILSYIFLGNNVVYVGAVIFPAYLWFRLRKER